MTTPAAPVSPAAPAPAAPAAPAPASAPAAPAPAAPAATPAATDPAAPAKATPDPEPAKPADPKPAAVPEKYDFKMPEGMTMDQTLADAITPILKEGSVTQEVAQKLVDAYAGQVKAQADAQEKAYKDAIEAEKADTIKALGADHVEQLAFVAKVRDRFFSKDTMAALEARGALNNVHFVQDLIKLGKAISEGRLAEGKNAGTPATAQTLYPSMPNP